MSALGDDITKAAVRLHHHLAKKHWNGEALVGPDPGVRFNARIGRFLKSYTRWAPWADDLAYIQAQKYWISCNLLAAEMQIVDVETCKQNAVACAKFLLSAQRPEGYWEHPNKEWEGRIATVEGNYGAIGLLDVHRLEGEEAFLEGAKRWYDYAVNEIGVRGRDGFAAINYFADRGAVSVPNVTVSALRTFALLADLSSDDRYLEHRDSMVRWLKHVQTPSGELPYAAAAPDDDEGRSGRPHFLCYQYNAFELLNLIEYHRLTADPEVWGLMEGLARFVATGVTEEGACRYSCHQDAPQVSYYTAAAAAALDQASALQVGDYSALAELAYRRVLSQQGSDGSMSYYSTGNYRFLSDRRSYPRYLAMTLYMLLTGARARRARRE